MFAYTQARLQARHGERLPPAGWRRLGGVGDFLQLLQLARAGPLRPWVAPFSEKTDMHVLELWLRRYFRQYIEGVARWQPAPWRSGVRWTRRLIDLPALRHLLSDERPWPWMREDEAIAPFVADDWNARLDALRGSDCAPLVQAWESDRTLLDGWLEHWRRLWPDASRKYLVPLELLAKKLHGFIDTLSRTTDAREAERERNRLRRQIEAEFRRHIQQPAAAYFHLALMTFDVASLRSELVRHRLFDKVRSEAG